MYESAIDSNGNWISEPIRMAQALNPDTPINIITSPLSRTNSQFVPDSNNQLLNNGPLVNSNTILIDPLGNNQVIIENGLKKPTRRIVVSGRGPSDRYECCPCIKNYRYDL